MPDQHYTSFTTGRSDPGDEERLVAAAKRAFEQTTLGDAADGMPAAARTIGRYRILSILGQGGMGIVYAAEQQEPRRRVALKVIRGGRFVDERYIRLFQREIQTLARLKHPGIASIYESGCTDDGQHFFAMEMVEGAALRDFIRRSRVDLRRRLDLFCKLCAAMNYAHQRGVIHRDLKPSNILVESGGNPKILDFGLARITDADVTCATVMSEPGQVQGTLAYMSPEQARGNPEDIDLRSDVYSLGVILYELLTDKLPYETGQSAMHEAVRVICEEEPRRPSRMNRGLRGDLEAIVLKTLAKEPVARYQSAAALADDLNRYAAHQPILARPPSAAYQLRKLVRRHRVGTAFLLSLFALLLSFGVWMGVLYRRAAYELAAAVSFKEFMVDVFRPADPNVARGQAVTVREILDRGAERIRHEFAARPELQAEIMDAIVLAYRHLGEYEQAIDLAEQALAIRRAELGEEHPAVARSLLDIGWLMKAKADDARAEEYITEALARHRRLLPADDPLLAKNIHLLATLRRDRGDPRAAEPLLREALAIRRKVFGDDDEEVAANLVDLADVLTRLGRQDEAESLFAQAEAIYERLPGKPHPHLASLKLSWAAALRASGKYEKALKLAREAKGIRTAIYGDDHAYVAITVHWLGVLNRDLGNLAQAEQNLRTALQWYRDNLEPGHLFIGEGTHRLAWVLLDKGDYETAGKLFRQALAIFRKLLGPDDAQIAEVQMGMARCALAAGDPERGNTLVEEALRILRVGAVPNPWMIARAESILGECSATQGRFDEAERLLVESRTKLKQIRGAGDRYVAEATERIVNLYEAWGKHEKAGEYRDLLPR